MGGRPLLVARLSPHLAVLLAPIQRRQGRLYRRFILHPERGGRPTHIPSRGGWFFFEKSRHLPIRLGVRDAPNDLRTRLPGQLRRRSPPYRSYGAARQAERRVGLVYDDDGQAPRSRRAESFLPQDQKYVARVPPSLPAPLSSSQRTRDTKGLHAEREKD